MKLNNLKLPSNKKFGLFFTGIFFVLSFYFIVNDSFKISIIFGTLSACFGFISLFNEKILSPLNKYWMYLGLILGKIISPIILGIIFYFLFAPIAIFFRIFGRDELRLKKKQKNSYWKNREPKGPGPSSFKQQF